MTDLPEQAARHQEELAAHIEEVAKIWYERACPPDGDCPQPELHDWSKAHPLDKEAALDAVAFILATDKVLTIIDKADQ